MKKFILAAFAVLGLAAGAANAAQLSSSHNYPAGTNFPANNEGLMGGGG
jgi:hypothetical protein